MLGKSRPFYSVIFAAVFLFAPVNFAKPLIKKPQQENHPPIVNIIAPKNNAIVDFDTQVNYEINVADKEDGNSKYDEINVKEVLLEVRYLAGKSKPSIVASKAVPNDVPGLATMRISNCFNCHNFNSKSIGPSFYDINKRYPATPANTDSLMKHIREGSTGVWGKETMPTHPELTRDEIKSTVQWILKHAADADVNYYIGTTGSFKIKPLVTPKSKGVYILTASYVDHGLKDTPGKQRLRGQDVAIVYIGK